jgi:magnesium chelatase family protein
MTIAKVSTVAFCGIDAQKIDVQVHVGPGLPVFSIVGLPDKSIGEAKERIRAVFNTIGLNLPSKRITINMAPASLQKEGSHYDLPIAIGLLVAMNIIPQDAVENWIILGELALDGALQKVPGVLLASIYASAYEHVLVCPYASGAEARLASQDLEILAPNNILEIINYVKGEHHILNNFVPNIEDVKFDCDLADVKGQGVAKRALEIAAAGGFHILLVGPPGVGKSMLARCLPTILPELTVAQALEVTMIYSIANKLNQGTLKRMRPYREPHHSASMAALIGGGQKALPGEISLAHNGVLFLDELAEYSRSLEGLRQSMESGYVTIARVQNHVTYPARAQIIAAMNPCKCGYYGTNKSCARAPVCAQEYQNKVSGPIMDRFDMKIYMNNFSSQKMINENYENEESSAVVRARVIQAIAFYNAHFNKPIEKLKLEDMLMEEDANSLLIDFANKHNISVRSLIKTARVARVIANLDMSKQVLRAHIAEALRYKGNN